MYHFKNTGEENQRKCQLNEVASHAGLGENILRKRKAAAKSLDQEKCDLLTEKKVQYDQKKKKVHQCGQWEKHS